MYLSGTCCVPPVRTGTRYPYIGTTFTKCDQNPTNPLSTVLYVDVLERPWRLQRVTCVWDRSPAVSCRVYYVHFLSGRNGAPVTNMYSARLLVDHCAACVSDTVVTTDRRARCCIWRHLWMVGPLFEDSNHVTREKTTSSKRGSPVAPVRRRLNGATKHTRGKLHGNVKDCNFSNRLLRLSAVYDVG